MNRPTADGTLPPDIEIARAAPRRPVDAFVDDLGLAPTDIDGRVPRLLSRISSGRVQ